MTMTIFEGALVFDGTGAPAARLDIAVEGDRIVETGTGLTGDVRVDVSGKTILPGMFDCHVHILGVQPKVADRLNEPFSFQFYNAISNLENSLKGGITMIRDCAGADLGLKQALKDGLFPGPRVQVSITAMSQTGGHMDGWTPSTMWVDPYYVPHPGRPTSISDGVTGVRKAVRQAVRAGADFIKVLATHAGSARYDLTRYSVEELEAIGEEARAAGLPVVVHAYGSDAVKDAIRHAGARSIEHLIDLDDEAMDLMVERGVWLVPTMSRLVLKAEAASPQKEMRDTLGHQDAGHDVQHQAHLALSTLKQAHDRGVKIAMGTDFGNNAGDNLVELRMMQLAGMPAEAVLHAATLSSAELMGVDAELGSIEAGKIADLVILDGAGVEDLSNVTERIRSVYQDGRCVHHRAD